MHKPIRIISWLLVPVLASACTTVDKLNSNAEASPWKKEPSHIASVEADRTLSAATTASGRSTTYFETHSSAPNTDRVSQGAEGGDSGKRHELNFNDADIRGVIDAILGDMLKLDYVIAPTVQGRITFRSSRPIDESSLLPALETALSSVSVAIVKNSQMVHVMPMSEAPQRIRGAQRIVDRGQRTPGFAVEILPLRYINANEMKTILESFVPQDTVLQADTKHGHLVIAGSSQDRAAVIRTVESFDVDWLQDMTFAVYQLEHSRPELIVDELRNIFRQPQDLFSNRVRLIPLDRVKFVLGMSKNKADLELVSRWIARLDVSQAGGKKIFVYNVQNGRAKDIAGVLQQVVTGEAAPTQDRTGFQGADNVQSSEGFHPTSTTPSNNTRLVAIEENNSLLFYGSDEEYQIIMEALRQIDVLPRQVMIEAFLAEVTLNENLRYGVQWFFDSAENTVTLSATDSGAVGSQFPGFSYVYSGSADARVVLNALQSKTDVRILSAPKLSTLNNQTATLQVGDQVPVVVQTSQSTDTAGAPLVSTIQMRDTGVILEVTPRINNNGNVILDVLQEVSEVTTTTTSGIDSPTIQQRKIHTVVATRDGFTVALGGLIRENNGYVDSGVPILKDIPIIGNLFKSTTIDNRRTELVILLVPHVMTNQSETQSVVNALIDGLQEASQLTDNVQPIAPIE